MHTLRTATATSIRRTSSTYTSSIYRNASSRSYHLITLTTAASALLLLQSSVILGTTTSSSSSQLTCSSHIPLKYSSTAFFSSSRKDSNTCNPELTATTMSSSSSDSTTSAPSSASTTPLTQRRATFPTVFLSHGGGPSYFMKVPQSHPFYAISAESENAEWLRNFTKTYQLDGVNTPSAIVVISAHYETSQQTVRVTSKKQHTKLNYDYGGFPCDTYELEWNPPGNPELAQKIVSLLKASNLKAELDTQWNFDHGVFIPLKMIFPEAKIPVVELSIDDSWNPAYHLKLGEALQGLKKEGVLIIGSGSSTHNFRPDERKNAEFMRALQERVESRKLTREELIQQTVTDWAKLPSARSAHPAEDHFVPYFSVVGAAGPDQKGRLVGRVNPAGTWSLASFLFE